MSKNLNAIQIADKVYWVGTIDWGIRNIHGYTTDRGTTYNAYLVMGDKITLFDTVKKEFKDEFLSRISSIVNPEKIDYIISNHSEPDHSEVLPEIIKAVKPEKVFASVMGKKALNAHYHDLSMEITAVKDGEELSLGSKTVKFMETRMLHWPDSMFSYLVEDKVLLTQDAFGMHLASSERFGEELPWGVLETHVSGYYANIITPYSSHVAKLFEKIDTSGLEIQIVAPDHGPVWRNMDNFRKVLSLYKKWSARRLDEKVVIIYDTMWESTEIMAKHIEDGARSSGVTVEMMPLYSFERSMVALEMLDASAVIVGAPTLNNNIFPSLADVLTYIKGLRFKTPYGAVFGSYGWSGEGNKLLREYLEAMGVEIVDEIKSKYVPDDKVKEECFVLGQAVANKVKEFVKNQ
ncbi:MAG: MBL fold metallo-hydrolase [Candidatus Scalindua sp.]|nr:MAG: MBL fold metallo-hydrolase [Candidatus Scalindua sp.]